MSREIKFRAWDSSLNRMFQIQLDGNHWDITALNTEDDWHVMQWIGLKDKNGTEIYEGDILDQSKFPEDSSCPYHVISNDGAFRKQYSEWDETLPKPILGQKEVDLLDDMIIGNIYENRELLENDHG